MKCYLTNDTQMKYRTHWILDRHYIIVDNKKKEIQAHLHIDHVTQQQKKPVNGHVGDKVFEIISAS